MTPKVYRHEDLSDLDIVQRCLDPNRQVVGGYGNPVIKLSEEVVVKFGHDVSAEEADNQRKALELLDNTIIRIPQVYRYFTWTDNSTSTLKGFLVMEFIHGEVLESVDNHQINQIAKVLSHFSTIQGQRPGPLQTGVSRGLLWEENGKPTFETTKQMERWLNFRLPDTKSKLALEEYPLVLCHLDLALRNIIWLEDGSVCFVDWASAGFYPRFFEVCLLKIMENSHGDYELNLIRQMKKLTEDEEAQMSLLERSFYNGINYYFPSISETLL
ncbi:hypothetical protein LHYA1_G003458 [Lachnellula hyalina]|uniref:Aminoglycoside phosphotransferase domain-containing protein n=1 Tax=Lachnellula hyalina TaxID=1316788 RepID=A0A8H8R6G9_9HELO|nr:uncharacterized protein LHYA1_G003458 [Lachnellula hyalina]TVY28491.1 hypothetical protein LHYA1_G003458 [Lachnellula hyalina]